MGYILVKTFPEARREHDAAVHILVVTATDMSASEFSICKLQHEQDQNKCHVTVFQGFNFQTPTKVVLDHISQYRVLQSSIPKRL